MIAFPGVADLGDDMVLTATAIVEDETLKQGDPFTATLQLETDENGILAAETHVAAFQVLEPDLKIASSVFALASSASVPVLSAGDAARFDFTVTTAAGNAAAYAIEATMVVASGAQIDNATLRGCVVENSAALSVPFSESDCSSAGGALATLTYSKTQIITSLPFLDLRCVFAIAIGSQHLGCQGS